LEFICYLDFDICDLFIHQLDRGLYKIHERQDIPAAHIKDHRWGNSQIPIIQIPNKFQGSKRNHQTTTSWKFGHWNLFVIWDLEFVIWPFPP
jgi:hypothetical protein